jgi:hypothetical protein
MPTAPGDKKGIRLWTDCETLSPRQTIRAFLLQTNLPNCYAGKPGMFNRYLIGWSPIYLALDGPGPIVATVNNGSP